jgi:hypothetical protein
MANPNPSPATRFRPGHSGNPDGSTAKVRHRILRDIRAEFEPMTALSASRTRKLRLYSRRLRVLAIRSRASVHTIPFPAYCARFTLAACSRVGRCGPVAS